MADAAKVAQNLATLDQCSSFIRNATARGRSDLAEVARKRAIAIRAEKYAASTPVELECIQAILAYEDARSHLNGKRTLASRTWPMLERYGAIGAVERIVSRPTDAAGYTALAEMGLLDYSFEAVVLRHQAEFTSEAVRKSMERLESERS